MTVNKEMIKEWVEALRSGEYEQAQGWLRRGSGFCCLGVLSDLEVKRGDGRWCVENSFVMTMDGEEYFEDQILHTFLLNKIGLANDSVMIPHVMVEMVLGYDRAMQVSNHKANGAFTALTIMNDNGTTFDEIADVIEAWFLGDEDE